MNNRQETLARNIGNNVKALRESAHLSQEELAEYLEVDLGFVVLLENGDRNISTVKLDSTTLILDKLMQQTTMLFSTIKQIY